MKTVTKIVKKYGNSGGVYVPSSWVGGKVTVELVDEPLNPRNVLSGISLEHIVSAIMYGSYARGEITEDSDMDIMLIADEDAALSIPDELKQKYDIQVKTAEEAKNAMMHDPVFSKIIRDEAVALINHQFLDSLRKQKSNAGGIIERIELVESSLGISKALLEISEAAEVIYPLIMRLKETLILECILTGKNYSTAILKNELLRHGLTPGEFSALLRIYREARSGKIPEKSSVSRESAGKLISLLEAKIKHVKQKAVEKGY